MHFGRNIFPPIAKTTILNYSWETDREKRRSLESPRYLLLYNLNNEVISAGAWNHIFFFLHSKRWQTHTRVYTYRRAIGKQKKKYEQRCILDTSRANTRLSSRAVYTIWPTWQNRTPYTHQHSSNLLNPRFFQTIHPYTLPWVSSRRENTGACESAASAAAVRGAFGRVARAREAARAIYLKTVVGFAGARRGRGASIVQRSKVDVCAQVYFSFRRRERVREFMIYGRNCWRKNPWPRVIYMSNWKSRIFQVSGIK